jgi:hypothetical protein
MLPTGTTVNKLSGKTSLFQQYQSSSNEHAITSLAIKPKQLNSRAAQFSS